MRPSEVPEVICDASRLRAETGWETTIPFSQSMEDIMEYWRERVGQKSSDEG